MKYLKINKFKAYTNPLYFPMCYQCQFYSIKPTLTLPQVQEALSQEAESLFDKKLKSEQHTHELHQTQFELHNKQDKLLVVTDQLETQLVELERHRDQLVKIREGTEQLECNQLQVEWMWHVIESSCSCYFCSWKDEMMDK